MEVIIRTHYSEHHIPVKKEMTVKELLSYQDEEFLYVGEHFACKVHDIQFIAFRETSIDDVLYLSLTREIHQEEEEEENDE